MTAVLTLDWPDNLAAALKAAGYTPERLSEEAMASLAADLFQRHVLSLGQAACLARMNLWDFKYPRTSGRKMVPAVHPYGSSKRSSRRCTTTSHGAPPGQKVGLIAARGPGQKKKRAIR